MKFRPLRSILVAGALIVTFSGCVYRIDVPQGNRIDAELVDQLEIGMSRNQVQFLLGSPAVDDLYHPNRWYYIYYYKTGKDGNIEMRHMTLLFKDDLLSGIEGSLNPG
ncbi:MAG: outer membrane protein assembly factor BamE [Gammaproteobacteria bacterium]|nr:outer membrane protein assembly factor BamE [Gammaproteobacteria bacterium]